LFHPTNTHSSKSQYMLYKIYLHLISAIYYVKANTSKLPLKVVESKFHFADVRNVETVQSKP